MSVHRWEGPGHQNILSSKYSSYFNVNDKNHIGRFRWEGKPCLWSDGVRPRRQQPAAAFTDEPGPGWGDGQPAGIEPEHQVGCGSKRKVLVRAGKGFEDCGISQEYEDLRRDGKKTSRTRAGGGRSGIVLFFFTRCIIKTKNCKLPVTLSPSPPSTLWSLLLKGLSRILELLSFLVVVVTFPISLFFTLKTTKEYERVVIFRLGRSLGRQGLFNFLSYSVFHCYLDHQRLPAFYKTF